jgi:hypothetical protein
LRVNIPECCCCAHRHVRSDPLKRAQNGHWTCTVHRCSDFDSTYCPHSDKWRLQFM